MAPSSAIPANAATKDHPYGQCRSTAKTTIRYAATIENSPWAKFTTLVARKISTKPSATSAYTAPIPRPVNRSWRTISISLSRQTIRHRAPEGPIALVAVQRSGGRFDVLVEDDGAVLVPDDVVAVQAVAIGIEVVLALGAWMFPDRQDGFADRRWVGLAGLVDRHAKHGDGVVRPRRLIVRRHLRHLAIDLAEGLRTRARVFRIVRDAEGAVERGPGQFQRGDVDDRRRTDIGNRDAELTQLPGEHAEIVLEREVGTEDVGARLLDRQHDRREVLALVRIALIERDAGAVDLAERLRQSLAARGAEGIGRMHDRPLLLAERIHAVIGDDFARVRIVRTETKIPLVAHMRQRRISAADHDRLGD